MAYKRIIKISITTQTGQRIEIENDLRIKFQVEKSVEKSLDKARVSIFNLSRETQKIISQPGNKITVQAGYADEGDAKTIFAGDVTYAVTDYKNVDVETKIEAKDGIKNVWTKTVSLSFDAGTKVKSVVSAITDKLGFPVTFVGDIPNPEYSNGFSFAGLASDALVKCVQFIGAFYSIREGQLYIFKGGKNFESVSLVVSPTSGLIGEPMPLRENDQEPEFNKTPQKYTVESLLYPQLQNGAKFKLESRVVNGDMRIDKVSFVGDNWEGNFTAKMEVSVL